MKKLGGLRGLCCCGIFMVLASQAASAATPDSTATEQEWLTDLPVVLTVTRLSQPQSEAPGALTVIDRETIRRSGARELADVLRLVPGYLVSGWNGANPNAQYHIALDDYGTRNLVLVDGRAVYSSYYLGDTHQGMMGLMLDDIERIEVLRGSNSAAYGANAMFGVINIITRHTADTLGTGLVLQAGEAGIADARARLGWGDDAASFRLAAGQRNDTGYANAYDDKRVNQVNFRGDLRPSAGNEVTLNAGFSEKSGGDGFPNSAGNPLRTSTWRNLYLHGLWRHDVSERENVQLSASYNEEQVEDVAEHGALPGVMLDYGGKARRLDFEFQHTLGLGEHLRGVWGAGAKQEAVFSLPLYFTDRVSFQRETLFGNLEWRPHAQWLINAGAFLEHHSWTGSRVAPRLMANFHIAPGHTLRAGVTDSWRNPTLFELAGDVRYFLNGTLIGRTVAARASAQPETLRTNEIGYLGEFHDWRMTLDVRAFDERMDDRISQQRYNLPVPVPVTGTRVNDYVNYPGLTVRGVEYQMRWKPLTDTEIWLNQTFEQVRSPEDRKLEDNAPTHAATLALFQKLPGDAVLSILYHYTGAMTWRGISERLPDTQRLDVRLAQPFHIGRTRAEAALTVQAAQGGYAEFLPSTEFERRAFATLRLDY